MHEHFYVVKTKDAEDPYDQMWGLFRSDGLPIATYYGHDQLRGTGPDTTPADRANYRAHCLNTSSGIGGGPP